MAGAATAAYSADALTSPGSVNGSQQQWDFSVPIAHDVRRHSCYPPPPFFNYPVHFMRGLQSGPSLLFLLTTILVDHYSPRSDALIYTMHER